MKEDLGVTLTVNSSHQISPKTNGKKARSRAKNFDKIEHLNKVENLNISNGKSDHNGNLSQSAPQKRMLNSQPNETEKKIYLNPSVKSFVPNSSKHQSVDRLKNLQTTNNHKPIQSFNNFHHSHSSRNQSSQFWNELSFDSAICTKMENTTEMVIQTPTKSAKSNFNSIKKTVPFECSAKLQMQLHINDSVRYQKSYEITQDLSLAGIYKKQNPTGHPFDRFVGLTLQQIKYALTNSTERAKYSQNVSAVKDVEQVFRQYTLQEIMDYFESSETLKNKGNVKNLLTEDRINSDTIINISKFFSSYTLQDIASILDESNRNEMFLKRTEMEGSKNVFDLFTGYTLKDVMACLNIPRSVQSPSIKSISCPKQDSMDNKIIPTQISKTGLNDYDKMYYGQVQLVEPNQKNISSRYAFARNEAEESVSSENTNGFAQKKTEIVSQRNNSFCKGQEEENSIYFSELNANQYYTVQTLNDTIFHTKSLMEQTGEPHTRRHLSLHPEDVDKLNAREAVSLVSNNDIEIRSDYCRKFGHSDICPYDSSCMYKDHDLCPYCGYYCIPKNDYESTQKHRKECEWNLNLDRGYEVFRMRDKPSNPETCEVCKKVVSKKASIHERLYGVLPSCDHVYCIVCAEKCRMDLQDADRKNVIKCNICGVCSPFYAASYRFIKKSEKREFLIGFIESMKSIKCRSCRDISSEVLVGTRICYHGRTIPTTTSMFSTMPLYRKQCLKLRS